MNILAIDPGQGGGLAYRLNEEVHSKAMPSTSGDILQVLITFKALSNGKPVCYLEDCVKYAGNNQSGSSMVVYGRNYGFLEGALMALGIKLYLVRPQEWQKELKLGTRGKLTKTEWKNKKKSLAQRLYPTEAITDKTGDALLILEYAAKKGET